MKARRANVAIISFMLLLMFSGSSSFAAFFTESASSITSRSHTQRQILLNTQPASSLMRIMSTDEGISDEIVNPLAGLPKVHHVTVCMVPPPEAQFVWATVTDMRQKVKDPGFFRWPPHANLLYPFLETKSLDNDTMGELLRRLRAAAERVEPFHVRLDKLGTFGGKQRGVLWLDPDSSYASKSDDHGMEYQAKNEKALLRLHRVLEEGFPMCKDQTKDGSFTPHMTLSHFANLTDASAAKKIIETDYNEELPKLNFVLDRIYLLRRQGDGGQFLRIADVGLGKAGTIQFWKDEPCPFPGMPIEEKDWIYEERMKLKSRRNGGRGKRGGGAKRRSWKTSRAPQVPDTPEVIAAKRAERKAKRERLEMEQQQQQIEKGAS